MKTIGIIIASVVPALVVVCCFFDVYAQPARNNEPNETEQATDSAETEKSKPKMDFVETVDFYMRDGGLVSGKLVSDDKNKIVIEQLEEGKVIVSTYSKREIDARTLRTRKTPAYKYYMDLADYFLGRTWDFRDDADDFIQAIRCCEKAKQSADENRMDPGKIEQINDKIKQIQADRDVWTREVKSRAELKKLEFEAEVETRVRELENKVDAGSRKIDESVKRLDKAMADTKDDYRKIAENIAGMKKDISRQFDTVYDRLEYNRKLIDHYARTWYYYPSVVIPDNSGKNR